MTGTPEGTSERVLVLTPAGRDGAMVCQSLERDGLVGVQCNTVDQLIEGLADAGAVIVAQEALVPEYAQRLLAALDAQDPWSDIPVILLAQLAAR